MPQQQLQLVLFIVYSDILFGDGTNRSPAGLVQTFPRADWAGRFRATSSVPVPEPSCKGGVTGIAVLIASEKRRRLNHSAPVVVFGLACVSPTRRVFSNSREVSQQNDGVATAHKDAPRVADKGRRVGLDNRPSINASWPFSSINSLPPILLYYSLPRMTPASG